MSGVANISRSVGQSWLTIVCLLLVAYFAAHAFRGDTSLSALNGLRAQQIELESQSTAIAAQRLALEGLVSKMGGDTLDPDLLEEMARKRLGFTHPDEIIILLN
jgi:cell division protein FtsB